MRSLAGALACWTPGHCCPARRAHIFRVHSASACHCCPAKAARILPVHSVASAASAVSSMPASDRPACPAPAARSLGAGEGRERSYVGSPCTPATGANQGPSSARFLAFSSLWPTKSIESICRVCPTPGAALQPATLPWDVSAVSCFRAKALLDPAHPYIEDPTTVAWHIERPFASSESYVTETETENSPFISLKMTCYGESSKITMSLASARLRD